MKDDRVPEVTSEMIAAGIFELSGYGCWDLAPAIDLGEVAASVYLAMVAVDSQERRSSPSHDRTVGLRSHGSA
jgi:hypothetical protein